MSHYQKHIFLCANQKPAGKKCCADGSAAEVSQYLKSKLLALDKHGPGKIRVSTSGCMGRCSLGPCLVVYPEGVWYRYQSQQDVDRIIERHLGNDELVSDLLIDSPAL